MDKKPTIFTGFLLLILANFSNPFSLFTAYQNLRGDLLGHPFFVLVLLHFLLVDLKNLYESIDDNSSILSLLKNEKSIKRHLDFCERARTRGNYINSHCHASLIIIEFQKILHFFLSRSRFLDYYRKWQKKLTYFLDMQYWLL